ncbi:hypothetical protein, partial [Ruminococcus sp.]
MKKLCLLLIPIVAVLSSCAEVPDNIKTNSKAGDSDTVSAADSYILVGDSVDGASKEINDRAFDNITVNDDLVVQSADKLYKGKLVTINGFDGKAEDIFKHYIGEDY